MRWNIVVLSLMLPITANAMLPKVIFEGADTQSIDRYASTIEPSPIPDFGVEWIKSHDIRPETVSELFPITTRMRAMNGLPAQHVNFQMPAAICVVGDDVLSDKWLTRLKRELQSLRAICWVVSAKSISSFNRLTERHPEIAMLPANGDQVQSYFNLTGYPVLITETRIAQ